MKLDRSFRRSAVLADGTRVTLRMVRPDDKDEIRRQFHRLSPTSRYRRFLSAAPTLSDESLRYLTEIDGIDHFAVVAATESPDLKTEVGLGVGRFVRLKDEPHVAEAAITVIDDAQRKGLGRLLLSVLTEAAWEREIRVFRAVVLADNAPMRHILDEAGAIVRGQEGDALVFDVAVDPPRLHEAHPLRRLLRMAAQSIFSIDRGRP